MLIAYWPLNEESGTTAYDHSGNEYNGTVNGAGPADTGTVSGPLGQKVYDFDGNDDYVEIGHSDALDISREITISFWLYQDSLGGGSSSWQLLLGKAPVGADGYQTEDRTYSVWSNDDGYIHLTSSSSSSGQTRINTPNGSIGTGRWYHYVGVIDRTRGRIISYINGVRKAESSIDKNDTVTNTSPVRIGSSGTDNYEEFDGKISQVRLYNRPLTKSEVDYLYSVGGRGRQVTSKKSS